MYWPIALGYFLTIPLLGILSFFLSKRIKVIQKTIVAETTALAGSTTESLRNIELIKSLGLAQQETERLNATTTKILKLELKQGALPALAELRAGHLREPAAQRDCAAAALPAGAAPSFQPRASFSRSSSTRSPSSGRCRSWAISLGCTAKRRFRWVTSRLILDTPKDVKPAHPKSVAHIDNLAFDHVSFQHLTASKARP